MRSRRKTAPRGPGRRIRILQVGVGRFGKEHLETWKRIEEQGDVELAGAVVATQAKRYFLSQTHDIPVHTELSPELLQSVDGVDVVTPSATHFDIVKTCLSHTHVLVEKPLATAVREAKTLERLGQRTGRVLRVNHIYRFHPTTRALSKILTRWSEQPSLILGSFLNPFEEYDDRLDPNLEFLHFVDLLDHLFGRTPRTAWAEVQGTHRQLNLLYPGGMSSVLTIGWMGEERVRSLELKYKDHKIQCDFIDNVITVKQRHRADKRFVQVTERPLERSLRSFVREIAGGGERHVESTIGRKAVELALRAKPRPQRKRPKVAVIGGGIFGATCAIELSGFCDVTLIERHGELFREATYLNQWRHHSGFHYPRSPDTIDEIRAARDDFNSVYSSAILSDVQSYFCTASRAQELSRERYLAVCRQSKLNFSHALPPPGILDTSRISLCILTDEAVLDFPRLLAIAQRRLAENKVRVLLDTEVVRARIERDGAKLLVLERPDGRERERYDFLVNATYCNSNLIAKWLGHPPRRLRFDLCEMLVLEIPIPKVAITVLDGPFTSLVNAGEEGLFTLSHIHHSVLGSVVTADGLPPRWGNVRSNRDNLLRHGSRYFPVLRDARIVESRFSTRAVTAYSEDYDGRPTVVTRHGFGCWSVLGGKIITCVTNAREIGEEIRQSTTGSVSTPVMASREVVG